MAVAKHETKFYIRNPAHGHIMYAIIKLGCTAVFRGSACLSPGISSRPSQH